MLEKGENGSFVLEINFRQASGKHEFMTSNDWFTFQDDRNVGGHDKMDSIYEHLNL